MPDAQVRIRVSCTCGRFSTEVGPEIQTVKLWCRDCPPVCPHEGGILATLDEWGHEHLPPRCHQALLWWACDAREVRLGASWRLVLRERLATGRAIYGKTV